MKVRSEVRKNELEFVVFHKKRKARKSLASREDKVNISREAQISNGNWSHVKFGLVA